MPRFVTITANLLAETTLTFDSWTEGATQRARAETFQVGGKGINVTKMLTRLGAPSLAVCFPGGATGVRCEAWLREKSVPFLGILTAEETRTGTVLHVPGRPETTFLGRDNIIGAEAILACARYVAGLPRDAYVALCGSVPGWSGPEWAPLREALVRVAERGGLSVDTYGPPLTDAVGWTSALVKINRKEFAGLLGVPQSDLTEPRMAAELARVAASHPVARWVVTDGSHPVWLCERGGAPVFLEPPTVREVSPTGSGDVLHAAILHGLFLRNVDLRAAVEYALPMAAANAAEAATLDFDLKPFGF